MLVKKEDVHIPDGAKVGVAVFFGDVNHDGKVDVSGWMVLDVPLFGKQVQVFDPVNLPIEEAMKGAAAFAGGSLPAFLTTAAGVAGGVIGKLPTLPPFIQKR